MTPDYQSVPPNNVRHVKTRYVYAGKGLPMKYDLDDEKPKPLPIEQDDWAARETIYE